MSVSLSAKTNEHLNITVHTDRLEGDNRLFDAVQNSEYEPGMFSFIEVDLDAVNYINSLGIAELISAYRHLKGNREVVKMRVINLEESISKVFTLVELASVFEIIKK